MRLFNIFKTKIPKDNAQEVNVLESWTVKWEVLEGWGQKTYVYHKAFIVEEEAKEYAKQLKESAKFIRAYISVNINKN